MPNVKCVNADCAEVNVDKDATGFDPEADVILCGECGERCVAS